MNEWAKKHKKLRFLDVVSALIWAFAWVVLAYTIATPAATWASAIFAVVGFFVGRKMAVSDLRTPSFLVAAFLLGPIALNIVDFPNRSPFLAGIFPGVNSLVAVTDFLWWGILSFLVVGTLQFLSTRYQHFVSLEVLCVALFLAAPFAAHRNGFINRPYFLIDYLWSQGHDPVPVLQGLGVIIALALILLTIGRATQRSSIFDVIILGVLALLLYVYVPKDEIRDLVSEPPGASGLTGKERKQGKAPPSVAQGGTSQDDQTLAGEAGSNSDESDNLFPFENQEKSDPKPVAVVIFRDEFEPSDGYYYFRQTAFSQFNGFRLVKDTTGEADSDLYRHFPTRVEKKPLSNPRLDISTGRLETKVALISSHTEPFGLTKPISMSPVPNPNPDKFERAYDVVSHVFKGDFKQIIGSRLENPQWSPETKAHYLQYPESDERYKKLADEIISGIPEDYRDLPLARVLAINLYLGEKGKYTTRKRPVAGSEDPTADFLFGDMTGYCVHFSHSSVYLLRAAGIPARVAGGYAVESRDRRGSALLLLSNRAHAWPEIWLEGLGWHPMDVAPQTYLDQPVPPPDFDLQSMLAEMARDEGEEYETVEEFDLRQMLKELVEMVAAFIPWILLSALVLCYGIKLQRRIGYKGEKGEEKIHSLYRSAIDQAYDAGYARRRGQGRLSFAEQHSRALPSLKALTDRHLSHHFGGPRPDPDIEAARREFSELQKEIAQEVPMWRRLLGALNPLSWYFTK